MELNHQPADYKSAALPLSHTSISIHITSRMTCGALGRNRTTDTKIFSLLLYRLSYQGKVLPIRANILAT